MMFVCVVAQFAIGGEEQEVKPSKVKGSFLLFDEGSVPKTDVKVYSAFVRKPASYNSAEALDVAKTMMNVKVGKEHGIFTLCVNDPAMGSLMGHVYFHERPRPFMDVSLQLNKLNKADGDYELPPLKEGQVMSGDDHPAQCAAAKEAEEWLAVRPLSRKEREARLRQQQAEHAPPPPPEPEAPPPPPPPQPAAPPPAAGGGGGKGKKGKNRKQQKEEAESSEDEDDEPVDPGPLTYSEVMYLKKCELINALLFHKVRDVSGGRDVLGQRLCKKLKLSKDSSKSESQKKRFARGAGAAASGGPASKKREGVPIDAVDDDDDGDDEEINAAKLRIAKAARRLEVLERLNKQASDLEAAVAAGGQNSTGAAKGHVEPGGKTMTGASPGNKITAGGSPFRELARNAPVYNYHRGAFEGSTVNIISSEAHAQQLQAMMGCRGNSNQLPAPPGHHQHEQQQRLTYNTPSAGSLSASSGGSVASGMMNPAGHVPVQQHTQHAQMQQQQFVQQNQWPQQPGPPPGPFYYR